MSKITLQQLAKVLAQKKHITQKEAEAFLRTFFDAILQNVADDKIVKIKGLGTFKLVEVLDRESVNINTGSRIVIPGHVKLSFTPDTSLKDLVNKPFADFQTVIINEGTSLEEMERTPVEPSPDMTEEKEEAELPAEEEEKAELPAEEEVGHTIEEEKESEEEHAKENESESVCEVAKSSAQVSPLVEVNETVQLRAMTTAEKWALTLGVALLCIASYFVGYYRLFGSFGDATPVEDAWQNEITSGDIADTMSVYEDTTLLPVADEDTVLSLPADEDTVQTLPAQEEARSVAPASSYSPKTDVAPQPKLDPAKTYRITGTRKTHIMKSGDYLTKIALQEYGHKDFARYIIHHNNFRDPDNVPIGAEVKLPELKLAE